MISLDGKWQINDDEDEFAFTGIVPGTVQGDLISQKLVPHPYIGLNEKNMRDLESKSWIYIKEFELDSLSIEENVELVFEGIDTLSDIYLNGRCLGNTDNMFLEYRFDIKDILKKGKNILKVNIKSPVKEPRALERTYGKIGSTHEESARPYIRKAQYSYGWDWGARVVTSGIWRPVYIESYNKARLTGCTAYLEKVCDKEGKIRISGYIASIVDFDNLENYKVEVKVNDKTLSKMPIEYSPIGIQFNSTFTLKDIQL
ncbi:MAG: glycoside hydrolase family 2 protein, partial [Candidatus Caldatribacteriota bacterium]|nr:glycoside hydrolase family 2 protein [Candidatus Caldatribacteriota bacterium]